MESRRWTQERVHAWMDAHPWSLGCNFTPSTASNQFEMWQEDTFDPATIDRELSWAAGLGMNTVRVYLHHMLHTQDTSGFLDRVEWFLSCAARHGISMLPVLFDGVWNPWPTPGPQREPIPRRHNSRWAQSPGTEILSQPDRWEEVRPYVLDVVGRFASDTRVLAWDLFNEPDQVDAKTLARGSRALKAEHAAALSREIFAWAREAGAQQPLTVGVWEYDRENRPVDAVLNRMALEESDIVSFHCYSPAPVLNAVIDALASHGRPLLCTEWLARSVGSTADLLPLFRERNVGAINWGLVDGRTQTRFPWRSWTDDVDDDEPWFHELLHRDGSPYDDAEAAIFRRASSAAG